MMSVHMIFSRHRKKKLAPVHTVEEWYRQDTNLSVWFQS